MRIIRADNDEQELRYGARVSPLDPTQDTILIFQTSRLLPEESRYTLDRDSDNNPIGRHVSLYDDQAIANAIRDALQGQL